MLIAVFILIGTFIVVGCMLSSDDNHSTSISEKKVQPYNVYITMNNNKEDQPKKESFSINMKEEFNKVNNNIDETKKELIKELIQELRVNRCLNK